MDKKVKLAIIKVTKVIKMFEEEVILFSKDQEMKLDEKGRPVNTAVEKNIRMAILTPKNRFALNDSIQGSFLSDTKEAYYILKEKDDFKISENDILRYKSVYYRITKIEENYGVFLRMELNIDDKRN